MVSFGKPIDEEPGRASDRRRQPVDAAQECVRRGEHIGVDGVVAHDFDELHARHRIEEVQADEAVGAAQPFAQLLERDARRVGGEDCVGAHLLLGRRVDVLLEIEPLRSRLDHEVGGANSIPAQIRNQAVERVADLDALVADLFVELRRALDRARDRLRLHVAEAYRETMPRAPRRDVAAHGAGTDDVQAIAGPLAVGEALHALAQEKHPH